MRRNLGRTELSDLMSRKPCGIDVGSGRVRSLLSMRTIKGYANRKLYDLQESRYVTLDKIAALTRQG